MKVSFVEGERRNVLEGRVRWDADDGGRERACLNPSVVDEDEMEVEGFEEV